MVRIFRAIFGRCGAMDARLPDQSRRREAKDHRRVGVTVKRRVAIIGTGPVGASVAVSTLQSGVAGVGRRVGRQTAVRYGIVTCTVVPRPGWLSNSNVPFS